MAGRPKPSIRITVDASNARGDLFTRMASDLFYALGYGDLRFNIPATGREIDVRGRHRHEEQRGLIAECKATGDPIGGSELNKFAGVVQGDRNRQPATAAYFVSLSGFTSAALEQEQEFSPARMILLEGAAVADELIRANVLIDTERAATRAAAAAGPDVGECISREIWLDPSGWYWQFVFGQSGIARRRVLVHADGSVADRTQAHSIVDRAARTGIPYTNIPTIGTDSAPKPIDVLAVYAEYIEAACGTIQLDGLPADEQLGSRQIAIDSLFVPLHLRPLRLERDQTFDTSVAHSPAADSSARQQSGRTRRRSPADSTSAPERLSIGEVLSRESSPVRIAILAPPGGGKSTLLKRLAVAYSRSSQRDSIGDQLPERAWFPMFIRCRDLQSDARRPFLDIIKETGKRAGLTGFEADQFSSLAASRCRSGEMLLLVDGLDEIAEEGARAAFVSQLRTFVSIYPTIALVVTSREAGFRVVAPALSSTCEPFALDDFDSADIEKLVLAWHRELYPRHHDGDAKAVALAVSINGNDRIRRLAVNPLLLTTLLIVNRWLRQLPTRRTVLYQKAIEVLLATWNVEGHEPIQLEEAIPRLAYLAYWMLEERLQRISHLDLQRVLRVAHTDLDAALGYSRLTDAEFVRRIESRSSLLVQTGQEMSGGRLVPVYEFRHLTFQEYLAAVAITEGHVPAGKQSSSILTAVSPFIGRQEWREVVPMVAVLAKQRAKELVMYLVSLIPVAGPPGNEVRMRPPEVTIAASDREAEAVQQLVQCLLDEATLAPADVERIVDAILPNISYVWEPTVSDRYLGSLGSVLGLFSGKFGQPVLTKALSITQSVIDVTAESNLMTALSAFEHDWGTPGVEERLIESLKAGPSERAKRAAILAMTMAFEQWPLQKQQVREMGNANARLLDSEDPVVRQAACWAMAWLSHRGWKPSDVGAVLVSLAPSWQPDAHEEHAHMALWAAVSLPLVRRSKLKVQFDPPLAASNALWLLRKDRWAESAVYGGHVAFLLCYYAGVPIPEDLAYSYVDSFVERDLGGEFIAEFGHILEFIATDTESVNSSVALGLAAHFRASVTRVAEEETDELDL